MRIPSKEEIEKASTRFDNPDAMYGFEQGAEWMKQQLEDINVPQSAEVITLESAKYIENEEIVEKAIELEQQWSTSGEMLKTTFQLQLCKAANWAQQRSIELNASQSKSESLQAELEKHQWISVKDRLPETLQSVLCVLKNDAVFQLTYGELSVFFDPIYGKQVSNNNPVTHWMPLPSSLKEGGSNG